MAIGKGGGGGGGCTLQFYIHHLNVLYNDMSSELSVVCKKCVPHIVQLSGVSGFWVNEITA